MFTLKKLLVSILKQHYLTLLISTHWRGLFFCSLLMDPLLSIKILLRLFFGKLHLASLATLSSENTTEWNKAAGVMEGRFRQKESVNSHCLGGWSKCRSHYAWHHLFPVSLVYKKMVLFSWIRSMVWSCEQRTTVICFNNNSSLGRLESWWSYDFCLWTWI